jgi:hypothetical protein
MIPPCLPAPAPRASAPAAAARVAPGLPPTPHPCPRPPQKDLATGALCLGKFSLDEQWYRAFIEKVHREEPRYEVGPPPPPLGAEQPAEQPRAASWPASGLLLEQPPLLLSCGRC